jgi:hypothetical protein
LGREKTKREMLEEEKSIGNRQVSLAIVWCRVKR